MRKRALALLLVAALIALCLPAVASAEVCGTPYTTPLIAGGGNPKSAMTAGYVRVWNDTTNLYVKYVTYPGWEMNMTHLSVKTNMGSIPAKNGNPIPGQFEFSKDLAGGTTYTYCIPLTWPKGTALAIAAHAEVNGTGEDTSGNCILPATASIVLRQPGTQATYFDVTVSSGDWLDGFFRGWCADPDLRISQGVAYSTNVYGSLGDVPPMLLLHPENLDVVNYILNKDWVGKTSPSGGLYTWGDVQVAIWLLLDDNIGSGQRVWTQAHVDEIMADGYALGEGFVPAVGQKMAVLMAPTNGSQTVLVEIPVPYCAPPTCGEETAWGAGLGFPGKNWATYFGYTVQ